MEQFFQSSDDSVEGDVVFVRLGTVWDGLMFLTY